MSCPNVTWSRALAHRFDPQATEPADWASLEGHLEACADCRRRAVAVDPSLLFSLRPPVSKTEPRNEAAAMVEAVTAMRRAARVGRHAEEPRRSSRWIGGARWTRWAAAAVVALATLSYGVLGIHGGDPMDDDGRAEAPVVSPHPVQQAPQAMGTARSVPVFEGLDRPEARVYEWTSDDSDVAVLMIVDESLDV